jgi:protocatechuate 3,4-dioxygenase beta subunit
MKKRDEGGVVPNNLTRRDLLGFAARGAATVVVTQALFACDGGPLASAEIDDGWTSGTGSSNTTDPTTGSACVLTAALTEGPYFVDEKLNRSDIRSDPATGVVSAGVPLELRFNVQRVSDASCMPLTGAYLDVWHCDAAGNYSDVSGGGAGKKFLRGYQITDANGSAAFTTIYPGWYPGRAVHVHFKLRLFAGSSKTYEFTSQFFFDEALTSVVHAQSPYDTKGTRNVVNTRDGIYNSLIVAEKAALTLSTTPSSSGYVGVINLGVRVG